MLRVILFAAIVSLIVAPASARIVVGTDYTAVDSTEAADPEVPTYNWIDPTSGTDLFSDYQDDGNGTLPIPFDVSFYGSDYATGSNIHACTNGWFSFDSTSTIYSNVVLPNAGEPTTSMCIYWDDLVHRVTETPRSHIYSYVEGSSPNRIWVLAFVDIYAFATYTDPGSFQMQIYENDGTFNNTIEYHYADVSLGATGHDSGESATVGMQNEASTTGITYSSDESVLVDSLAIRFYDHTASSIKSASLGEIKAAFK